MSKKIAVIPRMSPATLVMEIGSLKTTIPPTETTKIMRISAALLYPDGQTGLVVSLVKALG